MICTYKNDKLYTFQMFKPGFENYLKIFNYKFWAICILSKTKKNDQRQSKMIYLDF